MMRQLHLSLALLLLVAATPSKAYLQPVPPKSDRAVGLPKDVIPDSPFQPWPHAKVTSNGDYTEEHWIEELVGGPLYELQDSLPQLPIPTVDETIERLAPTCLPLAENDEEVAAFQAALAKFPTQAAQLQERLLQRQANNNNSNHSWLQHLWQTLGYVQVRDPVSPCVSYFLFVPDDDTMPSSGISQGVARAAAILHAMAEGRLAMASGQMPAEAVSADQPLCSAGFKYLFHACRVPQPNQDCFHLYDPARYSHVIIASQGQFYAMEFVNAATGEPLPLAVLQQRLLAIQQMAKHDIELPQLGWLTASDRDTWAEARQTLLDQGGEDMAQALETIESGAFVLNLDDAEPTTMTQAANCFWTGGSLTPNAGANRWHDKSMQLVCTKNGKVAWVGEHSMLDAAPVIPLIRRILKTTYKKLAKRDSVAVDDADLNIDAGISNVFAPVWESQPDLVATATKLTTQAKAFHQQMVDKYEMQVVMFEGYGKKLWKQHGFQGPELVQMAMQLAAYRLFDGQQVGTYEAALTRYFRHGRTGTARPVSPSSHAFVQAMGQQANSQNASQEEKLQLLRDATAALLETQQRASNGQGVDRHLFGLSCMMQDEDDDHEIALFQDPVYQRGKEWKLSTSAVIFAPGFGPSHEDGIGVGFLVSGNACQFTCSTLSKNQGLLDNWATLLEEALTELGELVQQE